MRVAVVGATGNVGSSVVEALRADKKVTEVIGIARHLPTHELSKVTWKSADISSSPLEPLFESVDAIIHLAWRVQPTHDPGVLAATNVAGSERVFRAAAAAGVKTVIYSSSVGAYSPGPKDRKADERWPTNGIATSEYSQDKVAVERILDKIEVEFPDTRWVRMRPGIIFKAQAAEGIRKMFMGPLLRPQLLHFGIPVIPQTRQLVFPAIHTSDVAEAMRLALHKNVSGAFNLAAEPTLNSKTLAEAAHAVRVPLPKGALRALVDLTWRMRLQPTSLGWIDMALQVPLLDTTRAKNELKWTPKMSATDAFADLIAGLKALS